MSVTELIQAAKRLNQDEQSRTRGNERIASPYTSTYACRADELHLLAAMKRLLLSLDVEAVERAKGGIQNVLANYKDRYRPVGVSMLDLYRADQIAISAAVIAALGE